MADIVFALLAAFFCTLAIAFHLWGFAFVFAAAIVIIGWRRVRG
jgi:hypothetical protein